MIDAGVGISTDSNSYVAGKNAAKEALHGMKMKPKVAIVAIDGITRKKINYEDALKGVQDEIGTEPRILGSTVNGILVNNRFALRSVGVLLIAGDFNVDVEFNYEHSRSNWEIIANDIFNKKQSIIHNPNQFMLMFQDGFKFPPEVIAQQKMLNFRIAALMSGLVKKIFNKKLNDLKVLGQGMPTVQEIVGALYEKGWNIPIIGNVATIFKDYDSYEFWGNKVYSDAVMGLILSPRGDTKFGYGFAAGVEPTGKSCQITKNIGSFIMKINDKPALEGFCNAVGLEPKSIQNLANDGFVNYHNILGVTEKVENKTYYHIYGTITDPDLPNLIIAAFPFNKVPEHPQIYRSDTKLLMKTTQEAIAEALEKVKDPKFFFGIDCIIRLLTYGDNYPKAIKIINEMVGKDTPRMIIGSGGEIYGTKPNDYYINNYTFLSLMGG